MKTVGTFESPSSGLRLHPAMAYIHELGGGVRVENRQNLLESLAGIIGDYRMGELPPPTPEHVDRWVRQFRSEAQIPLLREVAHVFSQTYIPRSLATSFLQKLAKNAALTGRNPCEFWKNTKLLDIQEKGHSQKDLLRIFTDILVRECGPHSTDAEGGNTFVYLDDAMFTGNRVGNDLEAWIERDAPRKATVHVIAIAIHELGEFLTKKRLLGVSNAAGKDITFEFWRSKTIENRKYRKDDSGVLWPANLPDDPLVALYLSEPHKYPFEKRSPGGKFSPFSSEQGRQLLEKEFLLAGLRIRSFCGSPKDSMRPLGYSAFGLGFGTMIVTFRNCPNNCPLSLWWGDPEAPSGPLNKWYPLLQRKTYEASPFDFDVDEFY